MTPQDPSMMSQDPSAAGGDQSEASEGGYTIELEVAGDGSITVSVESASQEGAEGSAPETSEGTPAKNIKDALTMALAIYKSNGQMPQGESDQDASFNEGFGGAQ